MLKRPLLTAALASFSVFAQAQTPPAKAAASDTVEMPVLEIVGSPEKQRKLPGSAQVIDAETLDKSRVFSTNEALRKISGLTVRDEEGFGLRPNIGIRGLNPTRSTKVLLLEDGIPLAYAPYGDNASYYHPPVERFDRIEVLKGAGQNVYGPQTVGGVINYITPAPPQSFEGRLGLTGGNRGYLNGRLSLGGNGVLFDATGKESDGSRDNIKSGIYDLNFKSVMDAGADHRLALRANAYEEDSQVTYSGLTDAEFATLGPRYNPFKNDTFDAQRLGGSATHEWTIGSRTSLATNAYYSQFNRDWWRQASTTSDGQCGGAFTTARNSGVRVDPDTCSSTQGRLRDYYAYGIEPRLTLNHGAFGLQNELQTGLRVHREIQQRLQQNAAAPNARSGVNVENNRRGTDAYSAFAQNRFSANGLAITPGLRVEHVVYERANRLTGAQGKTDLTEVIPSLGVTYQLNADSVLFAGAHRGFAPPRAEDILDNTGTVVDVASEDSRNYELGLRGRPGRGLSYETVIFRNDFNRQIAVGSIAGGSTPLAVGESLYQGLELNGRADLGRFMESEHNPFVELAYTHLQTAESTTVLRNVATGAAVAGSAPGNRMPYAPRNTFTGTLGYSHPAGLDARIEWVYVDAQFSDFANTANAPSGGNGQIGRIPSHSLTNAAVNYTLPSSGLTLFVAGKNVFDKIHITDRTRGIQVGSPALVQAGAEYRF